MLRGQVSEPGATGRHATLTENLSHCTEGQLRLGRGQFFLFPMDSQQILCTTSRSRTPERSS
jgi:hypothetical protein